MRRLLVLATSLALTAAACSDSTGPQGALSGTYTLRSLNGSQTSPWIIAQTASFREEVLSSNIVLDANGNYSSTTVFRDTYTGSAPMTYSDVITGYWTLSGSQLTLTDTTDPANPYTEYATVSGSTLTITDPYVGTQVYSK